MATPFPITIASVNVMHFNGEGVSLTCPGSEGELTILNNHEPFVSVLTKGTITVRKASQESELFEIEKGIVEVHRDGVAILL